jgi:hypothetical protein
MTEEEWLRCQDPRRMLDFLQDHADDRKLRLFACAAWRWRYSHAAPWLLRKTLFRWMARVIDQVESAADEADGAHRKGWWGSLTFGLPSACEAAEATILTFEAGFLGLFDTDADRQALCRLVVEIFGNPFRPGGIDPGLRNATILSLARAAYDERILPGGELDPARTAVLADAVEETGGGVDLLAHLRGSGSHVRGCWAIDRILATDR